MTPPPVAVTLLHGTFARGAPWTSGTSALSQALRARLGEHAILTQCEWTGGNTDLARVDGARRLGAHVEAVGQTHPDAVQFVVAHSHGGNVALLACRDAAVDARLRGIVCLSTPFLHYRENVAAAMALVILVLAATVGVTTAVNMREAWTQTARNVGMVGSSAAGVAALFLVTRRILTVDAHAFNLPRVAPDRVLIVRSFGDEASGLLGLSSVLQWLLLVVQTAAFGAQQMLGDAAWRTGRKKAVTLAAVVALGVVLGAVEPLRPAAALVILGGIAVALLPIAVAVALAPLRLLLLAAFGFDLPFRACHLTVTAEPTPPGRWTLTTLPPASDEGRTGMADWLEPMRHSEPYDHPEAIALVCDWIQQQVAAA